MAYSHASFKIMNRLGILIVFFVGLGVTIAYAQNLVPNGGFEEYISIPNGPLKEKIDSFVL